MSKSNNSEKKSQNIEKNTKKQKEERKRDRDMIKVMNKKTTRKGHLHGAMKIESTIYSYSYINKNWEKA